jgi:hypothetical protein
MALISYQQKNCHSYDGQGRFGSMNNAQPFNIYNSI